MNLIYNIIMPKLGITMETGKITKWNIREGEFVKKGQVVLEIETDKVTLEVQSEYEGFIRKILFEEGDSVAVTKTIAWMTDKADELFEIPEQQEEEEKDSAGKKEMEGFKEEQVQKVENAEKSNGRIIISPLAKRLASENNLDYRNIIGTGPGGRITKGDIENLLSKKKTTSMIAGKVDSADSHDVGIISEEATNYRKTIAQNMLTSKSEIPHYYVTMNVNATEIVDFKDKVNKVFKQKYDISLPFSSLLIKVVAEAIKQYPEYSSYYKDGRIFKYPGENIGYAVDLNGKLLVPVVKNACSKNLVTTAKEISMLVEKCKSGELSPDDMSDACFIISNLGMYEVDSFTAIISRKQSGILAVGRIKEEPVVVEGEIKIRKMMSLTLSSDHRLIDGSLAARFLKTIKEYIENITLFFAQ